MVFNEKKVIGNIYIKMIWCLIKYLYLNFYDLLIVIEFKIVEFKGLSN